MSCNGVTVYEHIFYAFLKMEAGVFADEKDKKKFLDFALAFQRDKKISVLAFVVLDDEIHFLVQSSGEIGTEDTAREMPEDWKTILELETRAIEELLSLLNTGRLLSGVIRIDGQIEAVTIGEYARTNSHESVLVHVEKANPEFRGIYQAINHDFCCHLPEDVVYVNREEDMGMENLRQTKLSYKPVKLAEKYEAAFVK